MACEQRLEIPAFQRGYVWTPKQALELIDSMVRGMPIGSILLWTPRRWRGPAIVLDGQQRLTTIRGALLRGSRGGTVPAIAYDTDIDEFVVLGEVPRPSQLPLSLLNDHRELWAWIRQRADDVGSDEWINGVGGLWERFREHKCSVTSIVGDAAIDDVREVFRRINTAGQPFPAEEVEQLLASAK